MKNVFFKPQPEVNKWTVKTAYKQNYSLESSFISSNQLKIIETVCYKKF